jgi:membrane fusion protein (multidrug efflux system)
MGVGLRSDYRLFRREAVAHRDGVSGEGDILRFDPRWLDVGRWLIAGAIAIGLLFAAVFDVGEYASGPAVVHIDGRRTVVANVAGTVEGMDLRPGQYVDKDAILLRLNDASERGELARATTDLELELVKLLVDPGDATAKQSIASLRARQGQARNAVDARAIRAPVEGVVTDVRVRAGQPVRPGDVVCAVAPKDSARASLMVMLPSDYRPMLKPGLKMRFELDGFRYEYEELPVEEISTEAIGPAEVGRLLGQERADEVQLDSGGKVLVTATLPYATFRSDGEPYRYFDGLTGHAEVRLRGEPLLVTLVPALRRVWR